MSTRTTGARLQDGRTFAFDEEYEPWRDADVTVIGITGRVAEVPEGDIGAAPPGPLQAPRVA